MAKAKATDSDDALAASLRRRQTFDPDAELRQRLAYVAKVLRAVAKVRDARPGDPVARPLEEWAADRLARFAAGEFPSLDAAFSLTPKRKRGPKPTRATGELMRRIGELREAGKTWDQIADTVGKDRRYCQDLEARRVASLQLIDELRPMLTG